MANAKSSAPAADPLDRDLFGAPVTQIKERWGRPAYAKTHENQILVATLAAQGWKQARIARYLRCDETTLRKHFSRELQAGGDLIEGQALEVLISKMRQGNMTAVKRVLDLVQGGRAAPPPVPQPEAGAEDDAPAPVLGKKEQLHAAAQAPSARWGSLLKPH